MYLMSLKYISHLTKSKAYGIIPLLYSTCLQGVCTVGAEAVMDYPGLLQGLWGAFYPIYRGVLKVCIDLSSCDFNFQK